MGVRTVSCPRCGAPVEWGPHAPFRPFCSERCKLIDLGAWATEKYRVPTPASDPGEPSLPEGDER
jgi:endogenous inhibitor of DNA gyrase (YacG/DUF329 family)